MPQSDPRRERLIARARAEQQVELLEIDTQIKGILKCPEHAVHAYLEERLTGLAAADPALCKLIVRRIVAMQALDVLIDSNRVPDLDPEGKVIWLTPAAAAARDCCPWIICAMRGRHGRVGMCG